MNAQQTALDAYLTRTAAICGGHVFSDSRLS